MAIKLENKSFFYRFGERWVNFKSKLTRKRLIVLGLVLLAVGYFFYTKATSPKFEVETTKISKGDITETISAPGKVTAEKYANLTFPTVGKLAWLGVESGDTVKKSQALASLDKTALNSAYQQALNSLRAADASVESTYDSLQGKDTTETFAERATRTTYEVAKDNAYEAVITSEYNLRNSTIYAPFSGIVTNFLSGISEGVLLPALTPIMSIIDPDTTYFTSDVSEDDVVKLAVGQKVLIELDAYPTETFEGAILAIDYASTATSTGGNAYKVKIGLPDNSDLKFRVGMNGDANFIASEKKDVLLAPITSVTEEDDKEYIWIVNNENIVEKIEVKSGITSVNDIEIVEGANETLSVIIRPPKDIKEGDKVKIK